MLVDIYTLKQMVRMFLAVASACTLKKKFRNQKFRFSFRSKTKGQQNEVKKKIRGWNKKKKSDKIVNY